MTTTEVVVSIEDADVVVTVDNPSIVVDLAGGPPGPPGYPGPAGPAGPPGVGIPTGGSTGQVLVKSSVVDYATTWVDAPAGGGGTGADEVHIGAGTPGPSTIELWVDTDEDPPTIEIEGEAWERDTATVTTTSLAAGASWVGTVALAEGYRIYRVQSSAPARVILYTTAGKQSADSSRPLGTDPTGDSGVVLEVSSTADLLAADLSPVVDGFDGKSTPDGVVPITVTNTGTSTATITVYLLWLPAEGEVNAGGGDGGGTGADGPPGPPGPPGTRGSLWYTDADYTSPPAVPDPLDGDLFLWAGNTGGAGVIVGDVDRYVGGGIGWSPGGNIRGPAGAPGTDGMDGVEGPEGPQGPPGSTGPANVLNIGTVTTGAAGSAAAASITGTTPAQTLNLTIPRGDTGATGPQGPAGSGGGGSLNGYLDLDSQTGTTDDDKLTTAMSYAGAQTYPPTILLGARQYDFNLARTLYNGFSIQGVAGMGNAEKKNPGYRKTMVSNGVGSGTWLSHSGSEVWDVTIRNIAFDAVGTAAQWMGGTSVYWCMNIRDCSWTDYKSVLGSQGTKLLVNLCLMDGWLSFNNSYSGAIHIGGSDNALFMGMTNIDSGTAYANAGGANGQYHLWCDHLEKSTIGPIYLTAEGTSSYGWNGIRVSGPGHNTTASNLGGPLWITGAKIEGRNAGAPCNGSLIRVEGGILTVRDTWLGYAMKNPTVPGHSPTDAGVVHQTAGQVVLGGCTYDRATGVAESVPLLYSAGGTANVNQITTGAKGGLWTGKPQVDAAGGTVTADTTVTVV